MRQIKKYTLSILSLFTCLLLVSSCTSAPEAKIERVYRSFTEGPKRIIPSEGLSGAKGVAVLSGWKLGALIGIQRTKGYVLSTGGSAWSNPPAIAGRSMDYRLQAGGALINIVLVLRTSRSVEAFKSGEYFEMGKQLSYSPGPRMKKDGTVTKSYHTDVWYYTRSDGVFTPASVHGLYIVPLKEKSLAREDC